jgi:predicted ester cyclase
MLRKAGIAFMVFGLVAGASVTAQDAVCDEALVRGNLQRVIDEGFNQGNVAVVDELFTEDFMSFPNNLDRAGFSNQIGSMRTAMPTGLTSIDHLLVEGCDAFFVRHQSGLLEGELMNPGTGAVPATGTDVNIDAHVYLRFNETGQVVEEWVYSDNLSLLTQAGVIPNTAGEMPMAEATAEATADPMMDMPITTTGNEARNADIVRQVFETGFNTGDTESVRGLFAPDFMGSDVNTNPQTVDQLFGTISALRTALPDATITINDSVAQGDYVATRVTVNGTFQGDFMSMDGQSVAPTGGPVMYEASFLHRLTPEGLVAEDWVAYDQVGLMGQMGMGAEWGLDMTVEPGMDMTAEAGMEATAEATADAG